MKIKKYIFWIVAPCSLVVVTDVSEVERPDDGGSRHFRNVGKLVPDCTAQQTRRQPSS
jgi:hypothetical protein